MSKQHQSASFDRAVRIELLRSRAAVQRKDIIDDVKKLRKAVDPRKKFLELLPVPGIGLGADVSRTILRHPYLLSLAGSFLLGQLKRRARVVAAVGSAGAAVYALTRLRRKSKRGDGEPISVKKS